MLDLFLSLNSLQWFLLVVVALLVGMTKTGIAGLGLTVVPLLAIGFGARESTGVLLPMLIMADGFAVWYYHRMAQWKHIVRLMPWALVGIGIGVYVGEVVPSGSFSVILAVLVLGGIGIMIFRDFANRSDTVPKGYLFAVLMGLIGGFATMMANAAGPVFAVYLLAMRLPKNEFIGTGAWFFAVVNLIKLPFHIWVWGTVSMQSFLPNLVVLPVIFLGALAGIRLVKLLSERFYRWLVIVMTVVSALLLLIR